MDSNLIIAVIACAVFFGGIVGLDVYARSRKRRQNVGLNKEISQEVTR